MESTADSNELFSTPPRPGKRRNDDECGEHESQDSHAAKRRKFEASEDTPPTEVPGYVDAMKLLPESERNRVYRFLQEEAGDREAWLFTEILILSNKVSSLAQAKEDAFLNIDSETRRIVEKTVIAVLLSSRTESYTPHALIYHTMNAMATLSDVLCPVNLDLDNSDFKKFVESEVLRMRTRFEQEIRSSMTIPDPRYHTHIKLLSCDLLAPSCMLLSVEACARVAVMRSVMDGMHSIGSMSFWAALDRKLVTLCRGATAMSSVRAFRQILAADEAVRGSGVGQVNEVERDIVDPWQEHVDQHICGFIFPFAVAQVY